MAAHSPDSTPPSVESGYLFDWGEIRVGPSAAIPGKFAPLAPQAWAATQAPRRLSSRPWAKFAYGSQTPP